MRARPTLVPPPDVTWCRLWPNTGSSQCSSTSQPVKGRLSRPPTAASTASTIRGMVMIRGDSWGLKSPWAPWAAPATVGRGAGGHRLVLRLGVGSPASPGGGRLLPPLVAVEDEEDLAAHVVGGEQGGDQAQRPTGPGLFSKALRRMSSFDQKPENGGTPAMASQPDDERGAGDRHPLAAARPCASCPARRASRGSPIRPRGRGGP